MSAKPEPPAPSPDLKALLCDVAQVFDGWHSDGTAWTAHDEEVRSRVSAALVALEPAPSPDLDLLERAAQAVAALQGESNMADKIVAGWRYDEGYHAGFVAACLEACKAIRALRGESK